MDDTSNSVSYYDVLKVTPKSSDQEIKLAYHKLAMRFHPDKNPRNREYFEKRFRLINEAYTHLKTREKRAQYNRTLRAQNDNKEGASWFTGLTRALRG